MVLQVNINRSNLTRTEPVICLCGDFYYGKIIEQRVCLQFCVSNRITVKELLKNVAKEFWEVYFITNASI